MFDTKVGTQATIQIWEKKYGKCFGIYQFRDPLLVITDTVALKQVFVKDFNNFADRYFFGGGYLQQPVLKKGVFFEDGANWKRIRRIMSPTFSSAKLKLITHYINLTAEHLGKNLKTCALNGKQPEAKQVFGAYALDVICGIAFGLDTNSQEHFDQPFILHAKRLMTFKKTLQLIIITVGLFPFLGHIFKFFGVGYFPGKEIKFFEENVSRLIKERKEQPESKHVDFLQLLINAEAEEGEVIGAKHLSSDEIVGQCIVFIIAGYETTSTTLQFLAYELSKNHQVQNKIVQEIKTVLGKDEPNYENCHGLKYMEAAINETLRMYPPVHLLSRKCENPIDLNGVSIPGKCNIIIPLGVISRNPESFPEPNVFKPERFLEGSNEAENPLTFLPFGFGPRQCLGIRLAMLELKIALVNILRQVKLVSANPEVLELEDYTGTLVPKEPIRFKLEPVPEEDGDIFSG